MFKEAMCSFCYAGTILDVKFFFVYKHRHAEEPSDIKCTNKM